MDWDAGMSEVGLAKAAFAKLIGAEPEEIAVTSSVSEERSATADPQIPQMSQIPIESSNGHSHKLWSTNTNLWAAVPVLCQPFSLWAAFTRSELHRTPP